MYKNVPRVFQRFTLFKIRSYFWSMAHNPPTHCIHWQPERCGNSRALGAPFLNSKLVFRCKKETGQFSRSWSESFTYSTKTSRTAKSSWWVPHHIVQRSFKQSHSSLANVRLISAIMLAALSLDIPIDLHVQAEETTLLSGFYMKW